MFTMQSSDLRNLQEGNSLHSDITTSSIKMYITATRNNYYLSIVILSNMLHSLKVYYESRVIELLFLILASPY
jgi:hypothetical protein